jgi:hypothetical protein
MFTISWFLDVSYIISPFAGLLTAVMPPLLFRGISRPLVAVLISSS